ncbi:ABC transporter substrate-binding protein [Streptomyces sp. GS7]|uniref:ABC transporter substrate-binding protein n=1 Tax=Streptomyces sp. GS7 TaxID=2692234 RepID=UPI0019165AF7|nr:ABC transporter substrate-binding protein [Streptomyces sp. GS7]
MPRTLSPVRSALPVLLAVLALLAAGCGSGGADGDAAGGSTVRVAHVPSTLFAPLYIAEAKGYFKEQGLRVRLETVKNGQDAVPLAASGKVDAVVAGFSAGLFNGVAKGLKVRVAASMGAATGAGPSPSALEVSQRLLDSGEVKTAADLRGRRIAVSGGVGAAGGYQLASALQESGLTLKDVTVVDVAFTDMRTALSTGSVAAALPPAPLTTAMEEAGVSTPLAVPPRGTVATGVLFGTRFAATPAAAKFLTALRKGAADLQGTGRTAEVNLRILARATGQRLGVLRHTPSYEWDPQLLPDTRQLMRQQAAYQEAGLLDGRALTARDLVG